MNDDDHFGVPASTFEEAKKSARGIPRMGMYVPTRQEVRTMDPETLSIVLDLWMWEGPSELIPTDEQIEEVLKELLTRADQGAIQPILSTLRSYLGIK